MFDNKIYLRNLDYEYGLRKKVIVMLPQDIENSSDRIYHQLDSIGNDEEENAVLVINIISQKMKYVVYKIKKK